MMEPTRYTVARNIRGNAVVGRYEPCNGADGCMCGGVVKHWHPVFESTSDKRAILHAARLNAAAWKDDITQRLIAAADGRP